MVIIENKLNNAQEQQCQLADYNAGLKHKGFNVVKTVCLQGSNFNDIGADKNLSIIELANLLENACGNCFELKSYITLLKNMGHKEKKKEKVKELFSLGNETLSKIRDLSRLFYDDEVSEYCFNEIVSELKEKSKDDLELSFSKKRRYLQIWNDEGYKNGTNYGYWIELWFRDYDRFEIWIRCDSENELKLKCYVQDETECDYYKHRDGVVFFHFPGKEWKTTMTNVIDEIWKLIKELYFDMIKQ